MDTQTTYMPQLEAVQQAAELLQGVAHKTPLMHSIRLSQELGADIWMKREDLQVVRSYKIRGAYHKAATLSEADRAKGIVCASAGNHAQGVAYACAALGVPGTIFMPTPTPKQKVEQVAMFGQGKVEIRLVGDTFDDAQKAAEKFQQEHGSAFIHPFDDPKVIEGQATVGLEILDQSDGPIDYLLVPIGGGGLASGVSSMFRLLSPHTRIIGVEPAGAPAMHTSLKQGYNTTLDRIDKFVDGAAVKRVGDHTFRICQDTLHDVITVDEGKVCETILSLYNKDAIVGEPAGALTLAALDQLKAHLEGKRVVCVVSGSNNDITRTEEIRERALLHQGLKHYFVIRFPQRAGALREFVVDILGPEDDITHFQYTKRHNRERGPAVIGVELKRPQDIEGLMTRLKARGFYGEYINQRPDLMNLLT
ncbi:MAG TPA: threonine dehydratase [Cytophagales bacterium]|nr:threonine dehydratase [Cytophagales bacterium]